jgi:glucose/arabinose dehydrogenase
VGAGVREEIYAYGFRNPWRFSFDRTRIAIADVGQDSREEVNLLRTSDAAGVNFGWPEYEGDVLFDPANPGQDPATFPMFTYNHREDGCTAIIGGYVIRDPNLPTLNGRYLYGDLCTGELRSFIPRVAAQRARDDQPVGLVRPWLTSFGRGYHGQIYMTQLDGTVSRLEP